MRFTVRAPLAITMWDFSWLERRWSGAGFEDWDLALTELTQRGYNAVRIDAYPHLVAADPTKEWTLLPQWSTQDWGSPAKNRVQVQPALNQFIRKCQQFGVKVALSTWYRQDVDDHRLRILTPQDAARNWVRTLESIDADLVDNLLYVDLCNEWPIPSWAPFFKNEGTRQEWQTPKSQKWMKESILAVRASFSNLPLCYSFIGPWTNLESVDLSYFDLIEPHVWMHQCGDFGERVGYNYERFSNAGYEAVVDKAEVIYRSNPGHWQAQLVEGIETVARWSKSTGLPLVTTECWGIVDYKDHPLLSWDWVKELCALGTVTASQTGRWAAIGTSNFCAPQFVGMWRDAAWHQHLTQVIRSGAAPT